MKLVLRAAPGAQTGAQQVPNESQLARLRPTASERKSLSTNESGGERYILKTAIPERVSGVRIPLPPPASLNCRETLQLSSENRRKSPQFRMFCA